jgi:hypothetical protein
VSQLEDIISQQYNDDSRSAYSARGGNRIPVPAANLGDKMKSAASVEANGRPGLDDLADDNQIP